MVIEYLDLMRIFFVIRVARPMYAHTLLKIKAKK